LCRINTANRTMNSAKSMGHGQLWRGVGGAGAAFAEELARRGFDLLLVARRIELLQQLAGRLTAQYGIQVRSLPLDLSKPEASDQISQATSTLEIGLLVYNAAYSAVGAFFDHPLEDHLREVDTNIRTPLGLVNAFGKRSWQPGMAVSS